VGMAQRQRNGDQDIIQQRHLKLVAEAVADLSGARRPIRLTQRDVADPGLAADERTPARPGHPQQQRESEAHENENRQQNRLNGHWYSPASLAASPRGPSL